MDLSFYPYPHDLFIVFFACLAGVTNGKSSVLFASPTFNTMSRSAANSYLKGSETFTLALRRMVESQRLFRLPFRETKGWKRQSSATESKHCFTSGILIVCTQCRR